MIDAKASAPSKLDKAQVNLRGWAFPIDPREEWRQMFVEAWRLERDYFYDPGMHGVDYDRILNKYLPWVERVTDRRELSELISHLVGELSTLHTFVVGGDTRSAPVNINQGSLGALLERDEKKGGYRIEHIFRGDPEILYIVSPLALPGSRIKEGDLITSVDGVPVTSVEDISLLLRNTVNRQVLLGLAPAGKGDPYEAIVTPISTAQEYDLRYHQWENERRMMVEEEGKGDLGYVHLRAMGGVNISEWARNFYPVFDRKGLIIDVRHNRGGNIDSWILEKLLRKAWFYWKPRVGDTFWNMQYAFRGHIVVLCNEYTASDGEAFAEGFKRLGLGKVIGTRTWGGEVWL
ncbi:MAG TPA: S41 family peptidase, partial [Candidatus Krumholzibacterium sp.]|nr:S41 family peptidase [Candidatus Krumholzibacterium sp.]